MKYMTLRMDSAQKVVDYLVSKPWAEVNSLLLLLQQSEVTEKEDCDGDRCVDDKAGSDKPDAEGS